MSPITDQLIELAKTGRFQSRKYVRLKIGAVQKRERIALRYLQRVKDCLRRVIEHAALKNVRIALEGRRGYEEIPTERELPGLLEEMACAPVGANLERTFWRMKKILVTLFQLSVTIAVLYWVYHDPTRRAQMVEAIRNAEYRWVGMGILAYLVVEIAAAFRWHVLLKVQKIHMSLARLSGLFFIGMFYNQFLPGGTGGDIIKSYYLLKETPDKKAGALLAVVFDRFIGLVALVAITATLIALRYDFLSP